MAATFTVQATQDVLDQNMHSPWSRKNLQSFSDWPLWFVEWALSSWDRSIQAREHGTRWQRLSVWLATVLRTAIIYLPLQLLFLIVDLNSQRDPRNAVPEPNPPKRPRYTRNPLDMEIKQLPQSGDSTEMTTGATKLFKATRLFFPHRLVMYGDKSWILVKEPPLDTEYIFISWHWASWRYDRIETRKEALRNITKMARHATREAGLKAYWLDVQCVEDDLHQPAEICQSDIQSMPDIVRNANHVAILLPDGHSFYKRAWARRLWTLPEALLARGRLYVWTATNTRYVKEELDRVQMFCEFWRPFEDDDRQYPARILAEYFEDRSELSRVEMVTTAIAALSQQEPSKFAKADIAHALVGLLRTRTTANKEDTLFQAMVKLLSLTNDNEFIIERMLSSYPYPARDSRHMFKGLLRKDQLGTYLWDIWPKCEVVGIDDQDGVVYLNDCRTLPISCRHLPDRRHELLKRLQPFFRPAMIFLGCLSSNFAATHMQYLSAICLSAFWIVISAWTFPLQSADPTNKEEFVTIEGALPLPDLEAAIFGRHKESLHYATSSSPLLARSQEHGPIWLEAVHRRRWIRELYSARLKGEDPAWIQPAGRGPPGSPTSPLSPQLRRTSSTVQDLQEAHHPPLLPGHTLFTLVHVPSGAVTLIQARSPPTTVLFAGTEGGMLRAVLCSSAADQRGSGVFQKEAVVRMSPEIWERATPRSWLRVNMLGSE